jgi:hypothetical protein
LSQPSPYDPVHFRLKTGNLTQLAPIYPIPV